MIVMNSELLSRKELALKLKRHPSYVTAMVKRGFKMPGGRASLGAAIRYLARNPNPRSRR
jgi:hypothetical protein